MSESQRREEGSIEEVLASIRRAIEDEAEEGAGLQKGADERLPQDRDSVIQLTQMVTEDGKVVDLRREKRMRDALAAAEEELAGEIIQKETEEKPKAEALADQENLGPVDPFEAAGAAAITKFLTQHPEQPIEQGPQMGDGRTLEEVVRQALVPHVREWLEANLATLVQNIVREEIEQLVRREKEK